jgi:predicted transcriptional regulator
MRPFQARDGRIIVPRQHIAKFNGDNNRSKSKVLIWLYSRLQHGYTSGLSALELSQAVGVSYSSLQSSLSKWYKWRYIDRRPVSSDSGHPHYTYAIADRGVHFVEDIIPRDKYDQYVSEIREFRQRQ